MLGIIPSRVGVRCPIEQGGFPFGSGVYMFPGSGTDPLGSCQPGKQEKHLQFCFLPIGPRTKHPFPFGLLEGAALMLRLSTPISSGEG